MRPHVLVVDINVNPAVHTRAVAIAEHVAAFGLAGVLEHSEHGPVDDFEYSISEAIDEGLDLESSARRVQDTHIEIAVSALRRRAIAEATAGAA